MEGQTFSHYKVLERLGGGGMGVVYKALDTNLNRHVALKFLPHELTRDDEARTRFIQEAQTASALDHPNICTIHEIGTTPEGQMFIAMTFYDGATLKKRIDRGAIPVEEALDIATQIARGLTKAHAAGIVHRDVKPANVMLTEDGFVKIVDFGIAKLLGVTGPTQAGSTLGTVSYMSPEQVAGQDAGPRSDVWALGAVLFEMLTGQLPFGGENQWAVMNSIANRDAEKPSSLRAEVSDEVEAVVMAALVKDPAARTESAEVLRQQLEACTARLEGAPAPVSAPSPWQALRRPSVAIPLVGVVVAAGAWSLAAIRDRADERWAREQALPEMLALIDGDDYARAFALAEEIERVIPADPILADAMGMTAVTSVIVTEPPGADVYVKPYGAPDTEWRLLGQSPVESVRLPRAQAIQLRVEKEGYEPRLIASAVPGYYFGRGAAEVIELAELGSIPEGMVLVPGGAYRMRITGFGGGPIPLGSFLIDRNEVTNAEFKEFVDAGGYGDPAHWQGLEFVEDGRRLTWDEAMARFVDETGRPGPATWVLGDYPEGRGDYPVTGVSWYEAVAYNRFRGKSLPTIWHWGRAAIASHNNGNHLGTTMLPLANFGGEGPRPVGSTGAMGVHGTYDMAGNVREWCWNASGGDRWALGGAWDDDARMASVRFTADPFDRSTRHGFRGVRYLDGEPDDELMGPVDLLPFDYRDAEAVSDEVYEAYRRQMVYVPSALEAIEEGVDDGHEDWTRVHVTLAAGYENERLSVYLFLPKSASPPYQPLVVFPGLGPFLTQPAQHSSELIDMRGAAGNVLSAHVKAGRAVVFPTFNGSYERWDEFLALTGEEYMRTFGRRMAEWASDLGRTIDYLETRDDVDAGKVVYWGASFGSSTSLALLDLEERLAGAVLLLPGFTYRPLPPEADAVNYVPRVTIPVLMIGGRYDPVFPVETSQQPLYDRLGTPPDSKRFELYDMGHGPIPLGQYLRDVEAWLDEVVGPVN